MSNIATTEIARRSFAIRPDPGGSPDHVPDLRGRRILFLVANDWYFCSHRLALAHALSKCGAQVVVMARENGFSAKIRASGFEFKDWSIEAGGCNPGKELVALGQTLRAAARVRADIVQNVAIKPIAYGALAARLLRIPSINLFAGRGQFLCGQAGGTRGKASLIRYGMLRLLRHGLCTPLATVVVQNREDRAFLLANKIGAPDRTIIIPGSGVNPEQYHFGRKPDSVPIVLFASRMLWMKGVGHFVDAATRLRRGRTPVRFVLAGEPDKNNGNSVPISQLRHWVEQGVVEWWGHQANMAGVLSHCSIVCLPTYYGEGIPKILIEAAAAGRPIIATDVPGCREIVVNRVNGLLIAPHSTDALASAIQDLLSHPALCLKMGHRGREMVEKYFSDSVILQQYLSLYRRVLKAPQPTRMTTGYNEVQNAIAP